MAVDVYKRQKVLDPVFIDGGRTAKTFLGPTVILMGRQLALETVLTTVFSNSHFCELVHSR